MNIHSYADLSWKVHEETEKNCEEMAFQNTQHRPNFALISFYSICQI